MTFEEAVRKAAHDPCVSPKIRRKSGRFGAVVEPCGLIRSDCTCCDFECRVEDVLADDWEIQGDG